MIDPEELPSSIVERVAMMEGILIASATGGSSGNHIYEQLRREFMVDPQIRNLL